nr:hypothetical protein GCM10020093_066780 [Planobispora longispora]
MVTVAAGEALPVTLLGYGVASGMGSMALYAGMAVLSDHHGPAGPSAISEANAVCVTVGIAVPFAVSFAAQSALGWRAALLLNPVATVLLALFMGRVWIPAREDSGAPPPLPPASPRSAAGSAGGSTWRARCCSAAWRWSSASTCGRRSWSPTRRDSRSRSRRPP